MVKHRNKPQAALTQRAAAKSSFDKAAGICVEAFRNLDRAVYAYIEANERARTSVAFEQALSVLVTAASRYSKAANRRNKVADVVNKVGITRKKAA